MKHDHISAEVWSVTKLFKNVKEYAHCLAPLPEGIPVGCAGGATVVGSSGAIGSRFDVS